MAEVRIRIMYDDQPNDIADGFIHALKLCGAKVEDVTEHDKNPVWIDYLITTPDKEKNESAPERP